MSQPRVLHIITSLAVGGAQRHLLSLLAGLGDEYDCDLVYFKDDDLVPEFRSVAGNVIRLDLGGRAAPLRLPTLIAHIRRGRYDLVHTHLLKADIWGAIAARLAGTPVISSKHNAESVLRNPAIGTLHGLLARLDSRVIALSSAVAEYMSHTGRITGPRMVVIHYGLDPQAASTGGRARVRQEFDISLDAPLALCLARLDPQKDHAGLLRAWAVVVTGRPDARLLLAGGTQLGGDAYVEGLHRQAAALGIESSVHFAGVRRDVPDLLAAADLLVMASRWEGLGMVFLEAMGASLPVVATRVGGVPEVVLHHGTGLLVPPGDSPTLAAALQRLIDDPELADRLGRVGRLRLETEFTTAAMVRKTLDLYAGIRGTIDPAPSPHPPEDSL
ncbi:MAG: glycosyltransferase [Chloroflexota bacterium]|jgi:glycosyltransferase involved in cell wall biosynthesis|nr:glycosyltransferase [Chloroflexota bacterium]MDP6509463.1 glycosyltransferase [Chloroflexota bacterium]